MAMKEIIFFFIKNRFQYAFKLICWQQLKELTFQLLLTSMVIIALSSFHFTRGTKMLLIIIFSTVDEWGCLQEAKRVERNS